MLLAAVNARPGAKAVVVVQDKEGALLLLLLRGMGAASTVEPARRHKGRRRRPRRAAREEGELADVRRCRGADRRTAAEVAPSREPGGRCRAAARTLRRPQGRPVRCGVERGRGVLEQRRRDGDRKLAPWARVANDDAAGLDGREGHRSALVHAEQLLRVRPRPEHASEGAHVALHVRVCAASLVLEER